MAVPALWWGQKAKGQRQIRGFLHRSKLIAYGTYVPALPPLIWASKTRLSAFNGDKWGAKAAVVPGHLYPGPQTERLGAR